MFKRTRPLALAAILALLGPAACTRSGAEAPHARAPLVFAASSLKEAFEALAPEDQATFHFAGSQTLRSQIEQGAHADVFASADERHLAALQAQGLVEPPVLFACNTLVLVVPASNPARLASLGELPNAHRIVFAAEQVPVGAYAEAVLEKARALYGEDFPRRVREHVVSRELDVRQVLAKVALGEVDAGLVYASDVAAAGAKVRAIPLPPEVQVLARYPVAVVKAARSPEAARAFVARLRSAEGERVLEAHGFVPCPGGAPR